MATTMLDYLNQNAKNKLVKSAPVFNVEKIPMISANGAAPTSEKKPATMAEFLKPAVAQAAAEPPKAHILTHEQIIDNIKALEAQGASQSIVQEYLDDLKVRDQKWQGEQAKKTVATPEAEKAPGFIQSVAQGIAQPFIKTAATAASAVKGVIGAGKWGIESLWGNGNTDQAKKDLAVAAEPVNIDAGYFGKAKPIGIDEEGKPVSTGRLIKDAAGTGIELAGTVLGGGAAKNVAGATIKGQILRGMGKGISGGFASGAAGGTGKAMQEDKTAENVVAQGVVSGIAGSVLGGFGGLVGPVAGRVVRKSVGLKPGVQDVALNQSIAKTARNIEGKQINSGNSLGEFGKRMAQSVAEGNERAVALAKEAAPVKVAADSGIDDAWLGMVKGASKKDVDSMVEMVKMAENNQGKMIAERPVAIAGKSIIDRVNFLKGKRTSIGRAIGDAKKNLPNKQVDITGTVDDFAEKLDGMGISVGKGGKLDFSDSTLNTPSSSGEKNLLEFIWGQVKPDENGVAFKTPKQLDLIRGRIQNELSAKPKNIGETTYAETLAQGLRRTLKGDIHNVSAAYSKLSNQYSEVTRALQDFYGLIQKEWNGKSGDLLDLRAGEVMSRILGNAAAKPQYILEQLEKTAQKMGRVKTDDPLYQIAFSDWLEGAFGQTQTRSLGGQVERATMGATEKLNWARGLKDPLGTVGKAIDKFGPGQKQQQQAMKALLEYYSKIKK